MLPSSDARLNTALCCPLTKFDPAITKRTAVGGQGLVVRVGMIGLPCASSSSLMVMFNVGQEAPGGKNCMVDLWPAT